MPRLPVNASQASLIPRLTTPCSLMTHGEQFSGVDAGEASPSGLGKETESCPASKSPWFQMPKQRLVAAGPGLLWHLPGVLGQTIRVWVSAGFALGSYLCSDTQFSAFPSPPPPSKLVAHTPARGLIGSSVPKPQPWGLHQLVTLFLMLDIRVKFAHSPLTLF